MTASEVSGGRRCLKRRETETGGKGLHRARNVKHRGLSCGRRWEREHGSLEAFAHVKRRRCSVLRLRLATAKGWRRWHLDKDRICKRDCVAPRSVLRLQGHGRNLQRLSLLRRRCCCHRPSTSALVSPRPIRAVNPRRLHRPAPSSLAVHCRCALTLVASSP